MYVPTYVWVRGWFGVSLIYCNIIWLDIRYLAKNSMLYSLFCYKSFQLFICERFLKAAHQHHLIHIGNYYYVVEKLQPAGIEPHHFYRINGRVSLEKWTEILQFIITETGCVKKFASGRSTLTSTLNEVTTIPVTSGRKIVTAPYQAQWPRRRMVYFAYDGGVASPGSSRRIFGAAPRRANAPLCSHRLRCSVVFLVFSEYSRYPCTYIPIYSSNSGLI